jgi:hypothetical protein
VLPLYTYLHADDISVGPEQLDTLWLV